MKKPVTIKEIAKKLDLSFSTVSRALHDHPSISVRTKQSVKKMAAEMGYEPNQTAIFFQQGKTFTIGVILPEVAEAFFATAISAIEDIAYKHKYTILFAQSHDNEDREKQLVDKLRNHRIDGLIVSVAKNTTNFDHFESLENSHIPVVYFDRVPPLKNINYVACNIKSGSEAAVNFLLKRGHKEIGLINGPPSLIASGQRKDGYIKALQANHLKFNPSLVFNCDLTQQDTEDALAQLINLNERPTAIVCFNDYVSAFAIQHALKLGLKVNEDIEFVSFSNSPITTHMAFPPIASLEQFPAKQAEQATAFLLALVENKSAAKQVSYKKIIEPELIENLKVNLS